MGNPFSDRPILNAPYAYPSRHWELDDACQPTQKILEARLRAEFITPIPSPKKQKGAPKQETFIFHEGTGLTSAAQSYDHTAVINGVRHEVDRWRLDPDPNHWRVTPKAGRLLQPSDPDSYYASRELVPSDLLDKVKRPKIVITNYPALRRRERLEISKGGRLLLQGRGGEALDTQETQGQMLQRILPDLMGIKA